MLNNIFSSKIICVVFIITKYDKSGSFLSRIGQISNSCLPLHCTCR